MITPRATNAGRSGSLRTRSVRHFLFQADLFSFAVKCRLVNAKDIGCLNEALSLGEYLPDVEFLQFFQGNLRTSLDR